MFAFLSTYIRRFTGIKGLIPMCLLYLFKYIPLGCPAVLTTAVQRQRIPFNGLQRQKKKEDLSSVLFFYVVLEVK